MLRLKASSLLKRVLNLVGNMSNLTWKLYILSNTRACYLDQDLLRVKRNWWKPRREVHNSNVNKHRPSPPRERERSPPLQPPAFAGTPRTRSLAAGPFTIPCVSTGGWDDLSGRRVVTAENPRLSTGKILLPGAAGTEGNHRRGWGPREVLCRGSPSRTFNIAKRDMHEGSTVERWTEQEGKQVLSIHSWQNSDA